MVCQKGMSERLDSNSTLFFTSFLTVAKFLIRKKWRWSYPSLPHSYYEDQIREQIQNCFENCQTLRSTRYYYYHILHHPAIIGCHFHVSANVGLPLGKKNQKNAIASTPALWKEPSEGRGRAMLPLWAPPTALDGHPVPRVFSRSRGGTLVPTERAWLYKSSSTCLSPT